MPVRSPPMQALRSTRLASAQKAAFMAWSGLLVDILQHFVGCGNQLAVHFVGALCLDHVDQFLDDIDVRSFKRALADRTSAFQTSGSHLRLPAGGGFLVDIVALRFETGGVDEASRFDPAQLDRKSTRVNSSH